MSNKQPLITDSFPRRQKRAATSGSSKKPEDKPKRDISKRVKRDADVTDKPSTSTHKADILREKHLNILRKFDMRLEYGPCSGITRLQRWERADKNGLNPPDAIKQLILKHKDNKEYTNNVWHDYLL